MPYSDIQSGTLEHAVPDSKLLNENRQGSLWREGTTHWRRLATDRRGGRVRPLGPAHLPALESLSLVPFRLDSGHARPQSFLPYWPPQLKGLPIKFCSTFLLAHPTLSTSNWLLGPFGALMPRLLGAPLQPFSHLYP